MSNNHKKIATRVKKESKDFIEVALRSGANNIGKQLLDAVSDVNQPSDIVLLKIFTGLKNGALETGLEIVKERLERV
ncbi:hypothetical protein [Paenibacillus sp. N3.4]|uniref:hypothetical protein n=1 Tax=Paenibacillus sp. N3.4 TaxID=2603222 RepID=UPI0011C9232D|nr:hypothetical protein [Paenibacillus sp. N3.4]TXK79807.1 hypothetical protein FU659_19130 [Paenibacillus sp. N3.4]